MAGKTFADGQKLVVSKTPKCTELKLFLYPDLHERKKKIVQRFFWRRVAYRPPAEYSCLAKFKQPERPLKTVKEQGGHSRK